MQHYRKQRSFVVNEEDSDATQQPWSVSTLLAAHTQPSTDSSCHTTALTVESHSKVTTLVKRVIEHLSDPTTKTITLKARGNTINKAITVAEIVKKKMTAGDAVELQSTKTRFKLDQHNHIFHEKVVDVWEPVVEGLDRQVLL